MWKPTKKQHLVNKKYADANGGGSGDIFDVVVTLDTQGDTPTATCNKTFAEIWAAYEAGLNVRVMGVDTGAVGWLPNPLYLQFSDPGESGYIQFCTMPNVTQDGIRQTLVLVTKSNEIEIFESDYPIS